MRYGRVTVTWQSHTVTSDEFPSTTCLNSSDSLWNKKHMYSGQKRRFPAYVKHDEKIAVISKFNV